MNAKRGCGYLSSDQVPDIFKEHFILHGYRCPQSSWKDCLVSAFKPTNETLNFWTHFLPATYIIYQIYLKSIHFNFATDVGTYPFLALLLTNAIFPLASSLAHLFNIMSTTARHICFFVDYAALCLYSIGVAVSLKAYGFPFDLVGGSFYSLYVYIVVVLNILTHFLACYTRFMENMFWRKVVRFSAFGFSYMLACVPLFYRIITFPPDNKYPGGIYIHCWQFIMAGFGIFFYVSHFPERRFPGTFDICGHSHQWFHVLTIYASYVESLAVHEDFTNRLTTLQSLQGYSAPSFRNTFGVLALAIVCFYGIIRYFAGHLKAMNHSSINDTNVQNHVHTVDDQSSSRPKTL